MKEKYDLVKLSDICEINIGKTPSRNKIEYWNGNHFWLSIGDMGKSKYIINTKEKITDEGAKLFNGKLVKPNTLLFSFKLSIGKVGIAEVPLYTNEAIASLPIKDKSKVDSIYLFYALQNLDLTGKTDRAVMGSTLNKRKLEQIKIPLPDIESQRRIAQILDKADEIIRKRRGAIALTEQLQKSIFLDMFGDPVTNPKGWEVRKLGDVGILERGKSKHRPRNDPSLLGGEYPLIQTGDVANSKGLIKSYTQTYSEKGLAQSKLWKLGTLCITIAANIADTGILLFDACFPDSIVGFSPSTEVTTEYIQGWFDFFQPILEANAPQSAQKNINLTILKNLNVMIAPIKQQVHYSQVINGLRKHLEKQEKHLQESENLFNSLLQRAFKGEL